MRTHARAHVGALTPLSDAHLLSLSRWTLAPILSSRSSFSTLTSCVAPRAILPFAAHRVDSYAPRAAAAAPTPSPSAQYFRFVADCRAFGISVPIQPGIMLVQAYGGFTRMVDFCKTRVPAALLAQIEAVRDSDADVKALGVRIGSEMSTRLLESGQRGLHYYTLNLEEGVFGILESLGLKKAIPADLMGAAL
jgi:hypothetical protein